MNLNLKVLINDKVVYISLVQSDVVVHHCHRDFN